MSNTDTDLATVPTAAEASRALSVLLDLAHDFATSDDPETRELLATVESELDVFAAPVAKSRKRTKRQTADVPALPEPTPVVETQQPAEPTPQYVDRVLDIEPASIPAMLHSATMTTVEILTAYVDQLTASEHPNAAAAVSEIQALISAINAAPKSAPKRKTLTAAVQTAFDAADSARLAILVAIARELRAANYMNNHQELTVRTRA